MATSTLDSYFKSDRIPPKLDPNKRQQDDVEVRPNYFVKKTLFDKLMEHQKKGLEWLFLMHEQKHGCVLADDMGLGKTLQTIALLSSLFRYERIKHVLIIAPTTLLINWRQEFKKWTNFETFIYTIDGSVLKNKRLQMIDSIQATGGILMLTYDLARSLQEELSMHRRRVFKWDYVILDEAHKIKNQSKTTRELNKLQCRLRIAITGTPVQNNLSELWSIFNFTAQGTLLGQYATFKRTYEKPIDDGRKKDANVRDKIYGNKIAKSLRKIYEPYLMRRTKEEVFGSTNLSNEIILDGSVQDQSNHLMKQNLPPKYDWCVWIRMNRTQIQLYEDFLKSDEVKEILANPTTCKSPLVQLNVLKKICDHPRLLTKNTLERLIYNEEVDLDELNSVRGVPVERLLNESSKLRVLDKLLRILISENHKILLFSTSTKMLDIVERFLDMNHINFCRLDGSIKSNEQREFVVQRFRKKSNIPVMLLTVQVGGVGLTLTEATRVIILNPNWNPGLDSQAIDRAYRIGQNNPNVIVYRFMTCTSIEEKIYTRQVYKDSLTKQTIGKENDPARYFTSTDLFQLFETGDFSKSKVCDDFNEIHGNLESKLILDAHLSNRLELSDEQQSVLKHRETIKNQISEIYDVSEHSLVFSKNCEKLNVSGVDFAYLNNEVKTAKELLMKESSLARGSHDPEKNKEIISARQRLLHQQFGTEFIPLGKQFNQYREGTSKLEFKKQNRKSPIKIIIDDSDEEISFVDSNTKTILPSLNNYKQSSTISNNLDNTKSKSSLLTVTSLNESINDLNKSTSSLSLSNNFEGIDDLPSTSKATKPVVNSNETILNDDISSKERVSSQNSLLPPSLVKTSNHNGSNNRTSNLSTDSFQNITVRSPNKKFSINDLSFNMHNLSMMSFEDQNAGNESLFSDSIENMSFLSNDETDKSKSDVDSILISSFEESIRLQDSPIVRKTIDKKKKNITDDSIIILD